MKIKIVNQEWKVRAFRLRSYVKHCGTGSAALCDAELNTITFLNENLSMHTICHELFHAYAYSLALVELDLESEQVDEFYCELFARHGSVILKQAEEIYNHFV